MILALATIGAVLTVAVHAGYACARFDFRGKNLYLLLIIGTMMIPGVANIVPLYILGNLLGLLDTYLFLVLVYSVWMVPMIIWLMKGFFESIPSSLEQAAMVDGYSRWYAFYRIILPLSKPGLAAAAILVFVYVWNEFIMALTFTSSDQMRTVSVGLRYYVTSYGIQWGELTAAVTLALLPVTVFFLILQRQFIAGMIAGAFKG
jgi:ABC-type glycerol-3-phosphate transport system permease component